VADDCTGNDANAVDASSAGVYVTGNFGLAGTHGSDNIARWTPVAGT
jgi:hypothetical protein